MRTLVGLVSFSNTRTRIHDYREAHKIRVHFEKEHLILVLAYSVDSIAHTGVIMIIAYLAAGAFHAKEIVSVD